MTRHVLMCQPAHYRITYEINPWMRRSNAVEHPLAARQWDLLYESLLKLGLKVELVEQGADVPDMTFAANPGIVCGRRFTPANFRYPERQLESARFIHWFEDHGYHIERIHEPHYWEGEGDVLNTEGTSLRLAQGRLPAQETSTLDTGFGRSSGRWTTWMSCWG